MISKFTMLTVDAACIAVNCGLIAMNLRVGDRRTALVPAAAILTILAFAAWTVAQ